jgi:hypothetical protein
MKTDEKLESFFDRLERMAFREVLAAVGGK